MPSQPQAPSWPFGKWFRTPAATRTVREQCRYCMGGGQINGCDCPGDCGGRGWTDVTIPQAKATTTTRKAIR